MLFVVQVVNTLAPILQCAHLCVHCACVNCVNIFNPVKHANQLIWINTAFDSPSKSCTRCYSLIEVCVVAGGGASSQLLLT